MADKVEKPKKSKAKPKKDEKGVLAALPSTRPTRIGSRRGAAEPANAPAAAKPRAKSATAKKPATAAKSKTTTPRATATRRKAAAPRTFEPTQAAEAAAGAADPASLRSLPRPAGAGARAGTAPPAPPPREPRPRAVREGAPGMGTREERERSDADSPESGRPTGVELVTTAVQAAGELTQIGLAIGGKLIKRAVDRIPKP